MDPSKQKEQFSNAFARAIAAVASLAVEEPSVDDDSVDISLRGDSSFGPRRPHLDAQLKCTDTIPPDGPCSYPLKRKNYDDLRPEQTELTVPRILIVLRVPDDVQRWLDANDEELILRHCSYWKSLRGAPERPENTTRITVELDQRLDADELARLMRDIAQGQWP